MLQVRRSEDRGFADHGWLKSYHSFSFADYYDPEHMQFRNLRVINEDWFGPRRGFPLHPHRDMEIITYILDGELQHGDDIGNSAVIRAGEVQVMHAGTGVRHSEKNPSNETTHLLQIWILPDKSGHEPGYEQGITLNGKHQNQLTLVASYDGRNGSSRIYTDADLHIGRFNAGREVDYALAGNRHAWVQVTRGAITVNGADLTPGDAVAVSEESALRIKATKDAEFLLFDLV